MRWLLVHPGPNFSVADVHNGWMEALRAQGEHVIEYNLDRRLTFYDAALIDLGYTDGDGRPAVRKALDRAQAIELAANGVMSTAYQAWPDVVLIVSAFFVPVWMLDVMRDRGHKVVLLHTESPYQDDEQLERAKHADINLLNDPVNLAAYGEYGPAVYMPHAYRPTVHYPAPDTGKTCDLAFVGTGFSSRIDFFTRMNLDGIDVRLGGLWADLPDDSPLRQYTVRDGDDCLDNDQTAQVYREARTGINVYRREAEDTHTGEGWAMGPREVEMAACGLWFARDARPESDDVFPMLPAYSSPEEAGELIRWALKHPAEREKAAAAAHRAIANRTFASNARALLRMIEKG